MKKIEQVRFRLYPNRRSRLYYLVHIFRTKAEMQDWARTSPHYSEHSSGFFRFHAICTAFDRIIIGPRGGQRLHNNIGHLLFSAKFLGAGITAHEITHAAVYWLVRHSQMKIGELYKNRQTDERFADAVGWMQSQFWMKFYRAKRKTNWLK